MEHWQKLVIDPGHFTVLKNLDEGKTKEKVAEEAGMKEIRCGKLVDNLMDVNLVQSEVDEGRRGFHTDSLAERKQDLKNDLASSTIGGVRESIKQENFVEARRHLSVDLPAEGEMREKLAKLEAAEKLSKLC